MWRIIRWLLFGRRGLTPGGLEWRLVFCTGRLCRGRELPMRVANPIQRLVRRDQPGLSDGERIPGNFGGKFTT